MSSTDSDTKSVVSIRPDSFLDELPDLSKFSLDEVIARFKDTERRRNIRTEPSNEAEVLWRVRSAPRELLSSLKVISFKTGLSRSVLTKCMSRQISDWYSNALGLDKLTNEYSDVYGNIKTRAYSTLRVQAENPPEFSFVGSIERAHTSFSTIKWVVGQLTELKEILGLSVHDLLMVGFMWSLTTIENKDWDRKAVDRFFCPEVYNFETLIVDRKADIMALRMKYEHRESTGYADKIFAPEESAPEK